MNSPTEHKSFAKWEKKERKDKGYQVFEADSTPEKEEVASPKTKSRAKPSFKISKKDKTPSKADKEKEERKKEKIKKKISRKKQQQQQQQSPYSQSAEQPLRPVIGVSLELAVRRSKSHDGLELPAFFRECIDFLEAQGLSVEGIYRISPVKSKVRLPEAISANESRHSIVPSLPPYHHSSVLSCAFARQTKFRATGTSLCNWLTTGDTITKENRPAARSRTQCARTMFFSTCMIYVSTHSV